MVTRKPVEPWPRWGRVLAITLFVVFFAALAVAVVVTSARDGFHLSLAAVRIFLAAVLVPGLVVLGVTRVLERRLGRLDNRLISGVVEASVAVRAELALPDGQRTSRAPDDRLRQAANLLDKARRGLEARSRPDAIAAAEQLRAVAAAWSQDSDVTRTVAAVGTTARKLRRTVTSLSRQRR